MSTLGQDDVNLRIRFAGLCLFVPDSERGHTDVLMPPTAHHSCGNGVEAHSQKLFWVSGGRGRGTSLAGHRLTLEGSDWGPADTTIEGVFDLADLGATPRCAPNQHGKVDVAGVETSARIRLCAGNSRIVNPGARWRISDTDPNAVYRMPTVLDWHVDGISRKELNRLFATWDVFGEHLPEPNSRNTVDLWILHLPPRDQRPALIGSTPTEGNDRSGHHFTAYHSLLACGPQEIVPFDPVLEADPGDANPAEWPALVMAYGMLITCMVARASPMRDDG